MACDVYNQVHMGRCAEICVRELGYTREQQDEYAVRSYKRALAALCIGGGEAAAVVVERE